MRLPSGAFLADGESMMYNIVAEIEMLATLSHPNILRIKEYFAEDRKVYVIMELMRGNNLLDALFVNNKTKVEEKDAKIICRQILSAIEYLHSQNIAHRDLKLENILLTRRNDINEIKLGDFGLATKMCENVEGTICGSLMYMAPEILSTKNGRVSVYGYRVDLWSAGVIMFMLLGGYPPFYSEDENVICDNIRNCNWSFNEPVWTKISENAKDLIKQLLCKNPQYRPSASEALKHPWFFNPD